MQKGGGGGEEEPVMEVNKSLQSTCPSHTESKILAKISLYIIKIFID